jgi:hypothetical protein
MIYEASKFLGGATEALLLLAIGEQSPIDTKWTWLAICHKTNPFLANKCNFDNCPKLNFSRFDQLYKKT